MPNVFTQIREKRKQTKAEFARLLGISRQRLGQLEKRATRADFKLLYRLYQASGLTAERFLELIKRSG